MRRARRQNGRRRRGSALVLVLAVLAVLAIFSLTLGYYSRMELMATRNWANGVQARVAAQTGVELFSGGTIDAPKALSQTTSMTLALKPLTIRLRRAEAQRLTADALGQTASVSAAPSAAGPHNPWASAGTLVSYRDAAEALAQSTLADASAKININAIVPQPETPRSVSAIKTGALPSQPDGAFWSEDALARFIDRTLRAHDVLDVNANQLAHNIAIRRYGKDLRPGQAGQDDNFNAGDQAGKTRKSIENDGLDSDHDGVVDEAGEGIDEPEECSSDLRRPPAGDDQPYGSLGELMSVSGMTPAAFEALAPYLTVFSASFSAFDLEGLAGETASDEGFPQVDPNTAPPETIYAVLLRRFPQAPEALLAQFTVNLIDRRDADDTPTSWSLNDRQYLGCERTPFINEVCSDVPSLKGQGDNGQFIELYNPFEETIDVSGWQLLGAGPAIRLRGKMPSGGFLVLTDDFNDEHDKTPEYVSGLGSFYKIFGKVPTGESKRIDEYPTLDLPDDAGEVRLLDAAGCLIDVFTYSGGRWNGATRSFQRNDPRVRHAVLATATPLMPNITSDGSSQARTALEMQEQWRNRPFTSAPDVMLVGSAYAGQDDGTSVGMSENWALPALRAEHSRQLDVRLVDCFRVGAVVPEPERLDANGRDNQRTASTAGTTGTNLTGRQQRTTASVPLRPACDVTLGRLNLNTASAATLAALPGMSDALLSRLVGTRSWRIAGAAASDDALLTPDQREWWRETDPLATPVWRNLSDFLLDEAVWQERPLYDRLDTVYPFFPLITAHSVALWTLSANRQARPTAQQGGRRMTTLMAERVLTADRGAPETVLFRYYGRGSVRMGDPDLRYARVIKNESELMTLQSLLAATMPATQQVQEKRSGPSAAEGRALAQEATVPQPATTAAKHGR